MSEAQDPKKRFEIPEAKPRSQEPTGGFSNLVRKALDKTPGSAEEEARIELSTSLILGGKPFSALMTQYKLTDQEAQWLEFGFGSDFKDRSDRNTIPHSGGSLGQFTSEYAQRVLAFAAGKRDTLKDVLVDKDAIAIFEAQTLADLSHVFKEKTGEDGSKLAALFLADLKMAARGIVESHMGPLPPEK